MEEKIIKFNKFENNDALTFAKKVLEHVEKEKLGPVRIRVFYRDQIVFQFIPSGKKGDEWLDRKQFLVMATGHSSYYVFNHQEDFPYLTNNPDIVHTGGGYPLYVNDQLMGAFIVSGLRHDQDHQLIINALKEMEK